MNFGEAIEAIKNGKKATREGWNGKSQYITLGTYFTYADTDGETVAFHKDIAGKAIVFHGTRGEQVGWLASQTDMLAEDWRIYD